MPVSVVCLQLLDCTNVAEEHVHFCWLYSCVGSPAWWGLVECRAARGLGEYEWQPLALSYLFRCPPPSKFFACLRKPLQSMDHDTEKAQKLHCRLLPFAARESLRL